MLAFPGVTVHKLSHAHKMWSVLEDKAMQVCKKLRNSRRRESTKVLWKYSMWSGFGKEDKVWKDRRSKGIEGVERETEEKLRNERSRDVGGPESRGPSAWRVTWQHQPHLSASTPTSWTSPTPLAFHLLLVTPPCLCPQGTLNPNGQIYEQRYSLPQINGQRSIAVMR